MRRFLTRILDLVSLLRLMPVPEKTYTIQGLFLKFLLEKKLNIAEILVVTFTKLATKELRTRILQRLQAAKQVLLHGYKGEDEFLLEFFDRYAGNSEALERIKLAIRNFDECSIYTIHGYCQKVLTDFSFYTATSSDFTLFQNQDHYQLVTENYWRQFLHNYSDSDSGLFYVSLILEECEGPKDQD